MKNAGPSLPLHLAAVTVTGRDASRFQAGAFPALLAAGESGDLALGFHSGGTTGCFYAWLHVESDDPLRPRADVGLAAVVRCESEPPGPPEFSHPAGTFADDFPLTLTSPTPGRTRSSTWSVVRIA